MRQPVGIDYERMTAADAEALSPIFLLPHDLRVELLERALKGRSARETIELFSQVIGMANSVVANNRGMVEMILVTEGGMHPHTAEKANLPTMLGALRGVTLAEKGGCSRMCEGCAYRRGTEANQSPITTADAEWSREPGEARFMCHMDLGPKGQPRRVCAGHARAVQVERARTKGRVAVPFEGSVE